MTTKQKIQQFKDYYLGGTLAVIAVVALLLFIGRRILAPQEEPALRIAVFDTELSDEAKEKMAQDIRAALSLAPDAEITIDSGYTSANTNEYARLSILAADGMVDAVIAGREAFAELSEYGYFKDLSLYLPQAMQEKYVDDICMFDYVSDAVSDDAQEMGELATGKYPFGLSLSGSAYWKAATSDSGTAPESPVLGVIMESENTDNMLGLIRLLKD